MPARPSIFAYMEGTPDARRLLDVGRKSLETGKPVMIWKAATTDAGIKAAASHTANMTGSYDLYRAALRQSGLIEVDDVEPIVDIAKLFAQGRLPKGNAVGVLSISGGSGIVYADAAVRGGMTLAAVLRRDAWRRCAESCPSFGSPENPADITAGFFNDMSLFTDALEIVLADPAPRPALDPAGIHLGPIGRHGLPGHRRGGQARPTSRCTWPGPAGMPSRRRPVKALTEAGVPFLTTPVRLARAAATLARFAGDQRRLLPRRMPEVVTPKGLDLPAGAVTLNEAESKAVLQRVRYPDGQGGVRRRRRRCGCRGERLEGAVRREDRLARHRPQDRSRRREARRCPDALAEAVRTRDGQRRPRRCPAPRSTACSYRRWRRASRR